MPGIFHYFNIISSATIKSKTKLKKEDGLKYANDCIMEVLLCKYLKARNRTRKVARFDISI